MQLPKLTQLQTSRDFIEQFGGYNHNPRINDAEFYEMTNLSSCSYPLMSTRPMRGTVVSESADIKAAIYNNGLYYVKTRGLYKWTGSGAVNIVPENNLTNTEKYLCNMGAYIIVMPDKIYVNTIGDAEWGYMENIYSHFGHYQVKPCDINGDSLGTMVSQDSPPDDKTVIWTDTSGGMNVIKQWIESYGMWQEIPACYFKLISKGISTGFSVGDVVRIGCCPITFCDTDNAVIQKINRDEEHPENDYLLFVGSLSEDKNYTDVNYPLLVGRTVPDLDYICESNNRLWGCRYGNGITEEVYDDAYEVFTLLVQVFEGNQQMNSAMLTRYEALKHNLITAQAVPQMATNDVVYKFCQHYILQKPQPKVNQIYASSLGDFKNWNKYNGISTDSYAVSVGKTGDFTGAVNYGGYPTFFKEDRMYRVMGYYPAQYQVVETECRGVQSGAYKTLAVLNERLYYKSREGVCMYDGSLPVLISSALGDDRYTGETLMEQFATYSGVGFTRPRYEIYRGASAGVLNNLYYIDMKSEVDGKWHLFVYDAQNEMWHREDNTEAAGFVGCNGDLMFIGGKQMVSVTGRGTKESQFSWECVTGQIGLSLADRKYVQRIDIRVALEVGSRMRISIQYDGGQVWEQAVSMTGTTMRTKSLSIRPKRCDSFRMQMEGTGGCKIYGISKTLETGSSL